MADDQKRKVFGYCEEPKKDGTPYWVDANIVPVTENGKIVRYIGAAITSKMKNSRDECLRSRLQVLKLL